jgi:hypothetical protein
MLRLPIVDLKMIYTASPMCKVSLVPHPHAHARCEIRSLHQVMIRTLSAPPGSTVPNRRRVVRRTGCGAAVPMAGRPDRAGEN